MVEQTVTLNPGESKVVSVETVPDEARTYQVLVDGLTGSFVASKAPPATGMITLYGENFPVRGTDWNWYASWYYDGAYRANLDDYYGWRGPDDACTPPEPIDLSKLLFNIQEGSYEYGYTAKHFGPFVVEDGKTYIVNWVTGELREGV